MVQPNVSPLDKYLLNIEAWVGEGLTNAQIVEQLRLLGVTTSEGSIRRAKRRIEEASGTALPRRTAPPKNADDPSFSSDGDTAEINSGKTTKIPTPDELMEEHGLDPNDWAYDKPLVSWWGSPGKRCYQLKLQLRRKKPTEFVFPGRVPSEYKPPKRRLPDASRPQLGVICGDAQVPFNDKGMEECFLQFLADVRPDTLTDIGDQGDNPSVSSHPKNPAWHAPINECIQATVDLNYARRRASENTEYTILLGNHDARLQNYIMNKAETIFGIKRGQIPDAPDYDGSVLEWAYLTRADDLGIDVVAASDGDQYFHAAHTLVDGPHGLIGEHGSKTGKNAMLATIERLDHSVAFGHTHTQGMQTKTLWNINGEHRTIYVANIGTQSMIRGGLGYANRPDWVHGFATYVKWPDGRFVIEFAKYEDGVLYWRDRRYAV